MSPPIAVPRWVPYALLFGLYLTARGYQSLDGDQAYRLPLLLHQQDPSLYAGDPFVRAFDAFNPHRGYLALLDIASRPFGLSFGLFSLFAATFALTCLGISRLARSAWPGLGPDVGLVAVALVLMARAGNIGTNHLFEPILLDRLIGFALGWAALALAVEGERWRPSLLVGLGAVVHPSVGLQLGGLLGATWLTWSLAGRWTGQTWRSTCLGWVGLVGCLLPGAWPTLSLGPRLFEGLTAGEFRLLGVELQMAQHMVPSLWRRPQWLAWGAYVMLGGLGFARAAWAARGAPAAAHPDPPLSFGRERRGVSWLGPPANPAPIRSALLFLTLLIGLALAFVMVEVVSNLKVTVFQPFRMATIARGLALVAMAGRYLILWRRDTFLSRSRALLLAAGLTGDWAFIVAAAVELVASLRDVLPAGRPKAVAGLVALCGLGYGLFFLARHDTESGAVPLGIGLAGAWLVGPLVPRLRRGWTSRRLAFAALASGALPMAAVVVPIVAGLDDPLARTLAARCRFVPVPTDDVERLAVWARENTPAGARFITPPGPKTFRLWSGRAVAFNRAASPYHAEGLKDWSDRFRAHIGFSGTTSEFVRAYLADRHGLERRYDRLSAEELGRLAASQGADHVLAPYEASAMQWPHDHRGPLLVLRVSGRYAIYRVEPRGRIACAECQVLRR